MTRILLVLTLILHICFAEYSKYQLDTFKDISTQCYQNLGIPKDSDISERIKYNRNITEDPLIKEFIFCGQKLLGWNDLDGNFQNEAIIRFFSDRYDAELVKEVVELCVLSGGETILDKVYNFHQCYFKHKKDAL